MMYHMVIYQHWGYYWSFIGSQKEEPLWAIGLGLVKYTVDSPLEIASSLQRTLGIFWGHLWLSPFGQWCATSI